MAKDNKDQNDGPKQILFVKNTSTSELISDVLKDLASLTKPHGTSLGQRFSLHPFDNAQECEYLARKYNTQMLGIGSHSKKRPNLLTLVRFFDNTVLDMLEMSASNFFPSEIFEAVAAAGHRPAVLFVGELFHSNEKLMNAANLWLDLFRGYPADAVDLAGLEHCIVFTALSETKVAMRCYKIELMKATGSSLPFVSLKDMGPFVDFTLGRMQWGDAQRRKEATKVPKEQQLKKKKNVAFNDLGDKLGRIHMEKQDLSKLQTRKVKALKKSVRRDEEGESEAKKVRLAWKSE